MTAADEELATYGFPPRPDKGVDADHYALWERAMTAAKIRWHGDLKSLPARGRGTIPTGSSAAQATAPEQAQPQTGPRRLSNVAASGVNLTNTLKRWSPTGSFDDIWTIITVPTGQLPFASGSCFNSGSADLVTFSFAGIGGNIFYSGATGYPLWQDGEEGGVYTDIDCIAGTYYTAYVSWGSPFGGGVFPVNAGDLFYTEVIAHGPNSGSVFVEDLTTLTYNSYAVSGSETISGNSAQWMVSRPCCYNSGNPDGMWPLVNTIDIMFDGGAARNGSGNTFYPGSQAASTQVLTMTNDQFNQDIELVYQGSSGYEGLHALLFQTTGCAYTPGCSP